jgi:crossover junction endodeoxyribonuclease RusA
MSAHAGQHRDPDSTPEVRKLRLVLPLPPSINHQYATVQGRRVLSRAGRDYKTRVAEAVDTWRDSQQLASSALAALRRNYLALTIHFYFATALRRDLDGGLKIAQDALCEALGINDNLVVEIHLRKRVDRQCPRIDVVLQALPEVVLHEELGTALTLPDFPVAPPKRRRKRRKRRSLEELATRFNWE